MVERQVTMSVGRIITSDACVAEGAAYLASIEPRFEWALEQTGPLPLRLRRDGFSALLDAIVSQQISVAAADSIWNRLKVAKLTSARAVSKASEEELRACGLSRPKVRYAKELSQSGIKYKALHETPNADVIAELTKVVGIGQWTAEIYAMFSLGRADVFASGDLALQESAKLLFNLNERPTDKQIKKLAQNWAPWRAVAARLLWAYYAIEKNREGLKT